MKLSTQLLADVRHSSRRIFRTALFYVGMLILILFALWLGWGYVSDWVGSWFNWPSWAHLPNFGWPDWLGGGEPEIDLGTTTVPESEPPSMAPTPASDECLGLGYKTWCWEF